MLSLKSVGENAIMVHLGEHMDPVIATRVQRAVALIEQALGAGLIDLVPSYTTVLVYYDPMIASHMDIHRCLNKALTQLTEDTEAAGKVLTLPVYYAPEAGADLEALAEYAGLSVEQVIAGHSRREYRVYAIGFAPGFAYLGSVEERIAAPRLATPRPNVPRGSVAIADRQTAVYPAASPGGWNLIGRCPTPLFNPAADPCMPFAVGDRVQFEPVTREQFLELGGEL